MCMVRHNITNIRKEAKNSAIKKIKRDLKKSKEFYLLKKLELLLKNGQI